MVVSDLSSNIIIVIHFLSPEYSISHVNSFLC
uniref:Uncharacterized protein n=1 Tax=Anguilla anguilla TaxID=7936 RepID=A0A0E9PY53_ANGAN